MAFLALCYSVGLPMLAGALVVRALGRAQIHPISVSLAYGYVIGIIALTLWMRLLSAVDIGFGVVSVSLPFLITIAVMALLVWRESRGREARAMTLQFTRWRLEWRAQARWRQVIWIALALLVLTRLLLLGTEIVLRPLYPWDAWTHWATKARVWFELGKVFQFVDEATWWTGEYHMDVNPYYPPTVPLFQTWTALCLGEWNDSLINLPWLALGAALIAALYSQLRLSGASSLYAMVGAYLLSSLPFLNTHIALAGYADLPMAVTYGLAVFAFYQWIHSSHWYHGVLALVLALACPLIKNPGWLWLATFLPALIMVFQPRHGLKLVVLLVALGVVGLVVLANAQPVIMGYKLHMEFKPAWKALEVNYLEFANWHLLWYLFPLAIVFARSEVFKWPLSPLTVLVGGAIGVLFVVFFFTSAQRWVEDFTTVNRATLHVAPAVLFYMLLLFRAVVRRREAMVNVTLPSAA